MLYYSVEVKTEADMEKALRERFGDAELGTERLVHGLNRELEGKLPGHEGAYCVDMREHTADFLFSRKPDKYSLEQIMDDLRDALNKSFAAVQIVSEQEITISDFIDRLQTAEAKEYLGYSARRLCLQLKINYFDNYAFSVRQDMADAGTPGRDEAMARARELMSDASMIEELERIYSDKNVKKFLGHPVHYKVSVDDVEAGYDMVKLLVSALYANGRLYGRRIDKVCGIKEECYDSEDFENMLLNAKGCTVVLDMRGTDESRSNYASCYEQVMEYMDKMVKAHCNDVLFIFLENLHHRGFSKSMVAKVTEYLKVIEIDEGRGEKSAAEIYMRELIRESNLSEYEMRLEPDKVLVDETYSASEIRQLFEHWSYECLRTQAYQAYLECKTIEKPRDTGKGLAYRKLQEMVGLDEIKRLADRIIATNVMDKRRRLLRESVPVSSKHMIFTGNPGSAKTTVARLLAEILKENGVLKTGEFVECGRGDLVGRYVGWTAKEVQAKFRQAKGGILFIDEAYALADGSHTYGDEAINTIVQEMENYREDVIVIFAGYPEKMKEFLDRNEGLRSRIAFHLDFPDYGEQELMDIFYLMIKERGYFLSEKCEEKVREICREACTCKDFGNGRFVRNMVEQAILKQSVRIFKEYGERETNEEVLFTLTEEDFDAACCYHARRRKKEIKSDFLRHKCWDKYGTAW